MTSYLTNKKIRAYKKGNNCLSFHLRFSCAINTNTSFSVNAYLKDIACAFVVNSRHIEFDPIGIIEWSGIPYNGKYLVSIIHMTAVTDITEIKPCLVDIELKYIFDYNGAAF